MNKSLRQDLLPNESPELIVAYNDAFNRAIATHLYGPEGSDANIADMTNQEFVEEIQRVNRQPLNPIAVAREALGYPEGTPTIDIIAGLKSAYTDLIADYEVHGIDGRTALHDASNIIGHTEAYITGYSREIGRLVHKLTLIDSGLNAPTRWHDKLWVPEEDMHDRLWTLFMMACGEENMETFNQDHARHMQVGTHLDVEEITPTHLYVTGQEGVTVPSYTNTALLYGPVLSKIPLSIKGDEARHFREYASVSSEMVVVDPDNFVLGLVKESDNFAMPGRDGIRNYQDKTIRAALAGVLDPVSILKVQMRLFKRIDLENITLTTDAGKRAAEKLLSPDGPYGEKTLIKRQRQLDLLRQRAIREAKVKGRLLPAILDVTVVPDRRTHELSFPMAA